MVRGKFARRTVCLRQSVATRWQRTPVYRWSSVFQYSVRFRNIAVALIAPPPPRDVVVRVTPSNHDSAPNRR